MPADMTGDSLFVVIARVGQNPLNQVVAVLVAGDVDEGEAGAAHAVVTNSIKIPSEELRASNLQAFLNYLRGILVRAVLRRKPDNVINSSTSIARGTMLTNVLDTPIAKLAVSDDVDIGKDFLNAWALSKHQYMSIQT